MTCAANLKDHKVLMIAGKRDDVVRAAEMALALWKASGEQKLVWYDCTHIGAAPYFVPAPNQVVKHLQEE